MIYCGYIATYGTSLPSSLTYLVVNSSGVVIGAISHLLTGLKHHSENNKFPMSGSGYIWIVYHEDIYDIYCIPQKKVLLLN